MEKKYTIFSPTVNTGQEIFKVASGDHRSGVLIFSKMKFWIFARGLNFFQKLQKVGSGVLIFSHAALFEMTKKSLKMLFLGAKPQKFSRAARACYI